MMKKTIINKKFKLFIYLFIFGIILGLIYYNHLDINKIKTISNSIKNNNNISINNVEHVKLLSFISLFSFIYIGILFLFGAIVSEGFIFIIRILILYKTNKVKGLIYGLIYYLFNNIFYLIFVYLFFKKIINIIKEIYIFKKKRELSRLNIIFDNINRIIILIILVFSFDLTTYHFFSKIINLFAFLLK